MEFNLEELEKILFWATVKDGELGLSEDELKLVNSIKDTLSHWGVNK